MPRKTTRGSVVAENLKRAIGETPVNAWALARKLKQPTIRRILVGETSPTEKMIETIATAMGLDAWQLLVPGMTVRNPPVLRNATEIERKLYERMDTALEEARQAARSLPDHPGPTPRLTA